MKEAVMKNVKTIFKFINQKGAPMKKYYLIAAVVVAMSANIFIASAANYTLTVTAGTRGALWNRFYERFVASCHAYTVIHSATAGTFQTP